ncbi:MAG: hypothetical protein KDJ77_16010 [Rhodobiaceae bacterium]|nr:hypothetical protein [Rhodobiaceae bacterium]
MTGAPSRFFIALAILLTAALIVIVWFFGVLVWLGADTRAIATMISAALAIAVALVSYVGREIMKTRNALRALYFEVRTSLRKVSGHMQASDYDAVKARIGRDRAYIPFVAVQPTQDHLYRIALDDLIFIDRELIKATQMAYDSELTVQMFCATLQSETFEKMDQERRQRFIDLMVNAFRENRRALRRLKMLLAEPHYAAALVMGRRKGRQGRT